MFWIGLGKNIILSNSFFFPNSYVMKKTLTKWKSNHPIIVVGTFLLMLCFCLNQAYKGLVAVRFTAAKGKFYRSDIALDDIVFR